MTVYEIVIADARRRRGPQRGAGEERTRDIPPKGCSLGVDCISRSISISGTEPLVAHIYSIQSYILPSEPKIV